MSYESAVVQRLAGIEKELHQLNRNITQLLRSQNQPKVVDQALKKEGVLCPICGRPLKCDSDSKYVTCKFCGCQIALL